MSKDHNPSNSKSTSANPNPSLLETASNNISCQEKDTLPKHIVEILRTKAANIKEQHAMHAHTEYTDARLEELKTLPTLSY